MRRVLICIGFLLFSCSPVESPPVRLGVNVWPGYEYLFLAEQLNYYQDEGLNIQLVETSSLDDLRRAYERGKIDGMASSIVEVVLAAKNAGKQPQIFMVSDYSDGADVVMASEDIMSVKDLRGKRVGVELASLGYYIVSRALSKHGMSMSDITVVPISQEEVPRAMELGQIDAVMTYPPISNLLQKTFNSHEIFSTKDIPGEVPDVVSFDKSLLDSNPDIATKILRVWQRAYKFAKENPKRAAQMSSVRQAIDVETFELSLKGVKILSLEDQAQLLVDDKKILTDALNRVATVIGLDAQFNAENFINNEALSSLSKGANQ